MSSVKVIGSIVLPLCLAFQAVVALFIVTGISGKVYTYRLKSNKAFLWIKLMVCITSMVSDASFIAILYLTAQTSPAICDSLTRLMLLASAQMPFWALLFLLLKAIAVNLQKKHFSAIYMAVKIALGLYAIAHVAMALTSHGGMQTDSLSGILYCEKEFQIYVSAPLEALYLLLSAILLYLFLQPLTEHVKVTQSSSGDMKSSTQDLQKVIRDNAVVGSITIVSGTLSATLMVTVYAARLGYAYEALCWMLYAVDHCVTIFCLMYSTRHAWEWTGTGAPVFPSNYSRRGTAISVAQAQSAVLPSPGLHQVGLHPEHSRV